MSERLGTVLDTDVLSGANFSSAAARAVSGLRAEIAAQAERSFLWLVIAFAAGVTAFFTWPSDPPSWAGLAIALGGLALLFLRRRAFSAVALAVLMFGLGHEAAQVRLWTVAAPVLDHEIGPFQLRGRVQDAEKRPEGNHVVLTEVILPGVAAADTPRAIRITLPAAHGVPVVGSRMGVRAVVGPVGRPVAPGSFQFQRFLYFQGIGASGFAAGRWYPVASSDPGAATAQAHAWTESLWDPLESTCRHASLSIL